MRLFETAPPNQLKDSIYCTANKHYYILQKHMKSIVNFIFLFVSFIFIVFYLQIQVQWHVYGYSGNQYDAIDCIYIYRQIGQTSNKLLPKKTKKKNGHYLVEFNSSDYLHIAASLFYVFKVVLCTICQDRKMQRSGKNSGKIPLPGE